MLDSNSNDGFPNRKVVAVREILTESCRSMSDPDLTTSTSDKERCSISSGDADLENTEIQRSMDQIREEKPSKPKPPFRYSDNSLERSEVKRILEGLGNLSEAILLPRERPPKRKGNKKSKNKHKDLQKIKKSGQHSFHSSDDIMIQESGTDKDGRRSSSSSPQELQSPVPKKKNGTGIFKPWKKKLSVPLRPAHSPLEGDPFGRDSPNNSPSILGGGPEPVLVGEGREEGSEEPSPTHHVVSNPVHSEDEKLEPDVHFNLETLVQPVNKNWAKCGYLWLRMKLPNGRYAWTHIVSERSIHVPTWA